MTRPSPLPPRAGSHLHRLLLVACGAFLLLGAAPTHADAHAYVAETSPVEDAVLQVPPTLIRVVFDSGVQAPVAAIRVWDADSQRVDNDDAHIDPSNDRVVIATVSPDLPAGPYVVTWRAVSWDDGHLIIGSFTFWVGVPTALAPADVSPEHAAPWVGVAALGLRVAVFGGLLVCAGVGVFHLTAIRHRDARWEPAKLRLIATVQGSAQVVVVASALSLPVQALADSGGGVVAGLVGDPFLDVMMRPFGLTAVARMVALLPVALRIRTTSPAAVTALWVIGLTTLALDGHSVTQSPVILAFLADWVHVHAAALWLGGVVGLAVAFRSTDTATDPIGTASIVTNFSTLAALAVAAVAATGLQSAAVTLGPVENLLGTAYGRTLLTKLAAVAVVIAVAAHNRWRLVPAVVSAHNHEAAIGRLQRALRLEVAGMLLVVATTGLLVSLAPAPPAEQRAEVTEAGIAITQPGLTTEVLLRAALLSIGLGALAAWARRLLRPPQETSVPGDNLAQRQRRPASVGFAADASPNGASPVKQRIS